MNIYSAVQVGNNGKALRGTPSRKIRAFSALLAGRLYAEAQGLPDPRTTDSHRGDTTTPRMYTFNPTAAQGAPIRVLVTLEMTREDARQVVRQTTRDNFDSARVDDALSLLSDFDAVFTQATR